MGLFWACLPFFGWSEYSLEGALISCSVEWNKRTVSVISYNICITIFVFFIPVILLISTNTKILLIVRISKVYALNLLDFIYTYVFVFCVLKYIFKELLC